MSGPRQFELVTAAGRLFDGSGAQTDTLQLTQLLEADSDSIALYLEFVAFDISLQWSSGGRHLREVLATESTAPRRSAGDLSAADQVAGAPKQATMIAPVSLSHRFSHFSRSVLQSVALVALCLYGTFVLVAWNLRPDKLPSVAVIRDATDVRWSQNASAKPAESSILSGELLKIESGTIELELNAGTKLVVEGPADWTIDGNNSVSLRAGKLMAHVPEQAIGFTVETPIAKVVDLGTEFGVEVRESGTTDVQVFKGKIEVHPGKELRDSSQANGVITLSAGEARRIEFAGDNGNPVVRKIAASPDRLIRNSDGSEVRRIIVGGALASSTFPGAPVNNLINGSGLRGECHSAKPSSECNMWHTEIGKVKDEYVLFDLGRSYRLSSMKVWNYNDSYVDMHRWRGVKQADIYISTSGRGTPLDHPEDWKLVAEDMQFEPGTGTPEYDTPSQIPLRDVSARFVALVIDEALGHDPRGTDLAAAYGDVVGLSEVQFFGVRSTPPSKEQR